MLLTDARRQARVSPTGQLITLDEQDRRAWDRTLIAEGTALICERLETAAAGGEPPGRYQLQAAINAVHTDAHPPETLTGPRSSPSTTTW
jgi:predicted RNA polymerase sigma factor